MAINLFIAQELANLMASRHACKFDRTQLGLYIKKTSIIVKVQIDRVEHRWISGAHPRGLLASYAAKCWMMIILPRLEELVHLALAEHFLKQQSMLR